MNFMTILLIVLTCIILLPILVLFVQVICAYLPKHHKNIVDDSLCRVAVMIPAHNESTGISATISSILPHMQATDRVVVIADNCDDDTAQIALDAGVEVVERYDELQRGKGFALDCGVRYLESDPPDVVVIVDADCIIEQGSLRSLATHSYQLLRPVQSLYLMLTLPEAGLKSKIAQFAWMVKNKVRPLGFDQLGLPCPLMGSGMAFPWKQISSVALSSDNIVEDVKLGIDLAKMGHPPIFFPQTLVTSYFPVSTESQATQRKRWEHGHLTMILIEAPKLFLTALMRMDVRLISMALDLVVPPIALLVMLLVALTAIILLSYWSGLIAAFVLWLLAMALSLLTITIMGAWWGWARSILPFTGFLMAPIYVLGKIPNYFLYLVKRQKKWVRTDRD
jgi:cellulose synthase/poly-beta-1,6-N-acetylglucosamine synthase-like glycosyltransferase